MRRRLILHDEAYRDLVEYADYMALHSASAARNFLECADSTIRMLHRSPFLGHAGEFTHPELANLRSQTITRFRKYLVFYRVNPQTVEIVRIVHGARDLPNVLLRHD